MRKLAICTTITALTLVVAALGKGNAISQYKVTELAPLAGYQSSYALAVSNSGTAVGWVFSRTADEYEERAVVWKNGVVEELPASERFSEARAINSDGVIIGDIGPGTMNPCVWNQGSYVDLTPVFGSETNNYLVDINDHGQITGHQSDGQGTYRPFILSGNTFKFMPGSMPGKGYPAAINNKGQVAGCMDYGTYLRAFIWDGDSVTSIGTLGASSSRAYDINDNGWVVGESSTEEQGYTSVWAAFLWKDNTISPLAGLGGIYSSANAVNNKNQIVGYATDNYGVETACMWVGDSVVDLNSMIDSGSGWHLSSAGAINDNGTIIGNGYYNGQQRVFMLTPTPEPSSLAAISFGAACALGGIARRRRTPKA